MTTNVEPVEVMGVHCDKGHFNDPEIAYCAVCGLSTVHTGRPMRGVRPQLGVLVLDDGTVSPLLRDHVIGSRPENDPAVAAGRANAVSFPDPQVAVVHLRVVLDGWDVTAVAEATGAFVRHPQVNGWTPLAKGTAVRLPPGAALACGRRRLHYHSYRSLLGERSL
ncbi:hypothetical protein [Allorhizocola rhizosphaerae]|uniref:hypothetical protein n=1 Tax=Allorhizocola rhizosphaerae TaxID=1872709 RepID=UPI000E3DFA40|nr:hypothetical protein [Allorhizocola rhizosphaerae]